MRISTQRRVAAALCLGLALLGTACSTTTPTPTTTRLPFDEHPACASAIASAPPQVLSQPRRGDTSWGNPPIVIRCGLPEQPPTTLHCLTVNGIDWTIDLSGEPIVAITYGRQPALEVQVPRSYGVTSVSAALVDLQPAAAVLPRTHRSCS